MGGSRTHKSNRVATGEAASEKQPKDARDDHRGGARDARIGGRRVDRDVHVERHVDEPRLLLRVGFDDVHANARQDVDAREDGASRKRRRRERGAARDAQGHQGTA